MEKEIKITLGIGAAMVIAVIVLASMWCMKPTSAFTIEVNYISGEIETVELQCKKKLWLSERGCISCMNSSLICGSRKFTVIKTTEL